MEPPSWHPLHSDWLHWNHLVHWNQSTANDLEYRHALQKRTEIEAQVARGGDAPVDPAMFTRVASPTPIPIGTAPKTPLTPIPIGTGSRTPQTPTPFGTAPPMGPSGIAPISTAASRQAQALRVFTGDEPPRRDDGQPPRGEGEGPPPPGGEGEGEGKPPPPPGDGGEAARRAADAQAESDAAKLRALQEANAAAKLAAIELAERKAKEAAHWNAVSRARQQSKKADLGVRAGEQQAAIVGELATLPTPYGPDSPGQEEQTAFNAAIEEMATKLATTEDEMRKTQALMVGLEQARIDTEQRQAAAAQQLQAIGVFSDPRASFFEQFSRAPQGTPIQVGPELSAVMRGQTIPSYGEIRHYTEGQPQLETIANDPASIRRAFEGAVGRLTTESIQGLSPRAVDQMSVLGQIGGYFPTEVFRAREAAIPKQPRLVRSMQTG